LVATHDDEQLKREKLELIARDNIIFEFGLYVGRLGRHRAFLFKERNLDLPTDLLGISVAEYKINPADPGPTLEELCEKTKADILELWKTFHLSFVPSTVLAVGYFENFVARVSRELKQAAKRKVQDKSYADFKLYIIVPDELPNNFNDQVISYLSDKNLKEMRVETDTRKYNFYLDYSTTENDVLELYDLPTTLSALKTSIEKAVPSGYIGESQRERILKKKEMNNFCKTLAYLVEENPITRKHVEIKFINIKG
jgi:hypothetical protein